jgi:hypothetical protein
MMGLALYLLHCEKRTPQKTFLSHPWFLGLQDKRYGPILLSVPYLTTYEFSKSKYRDGSATYLHAICPSQSLPALDV